MASIAHPTLTRTRVVDAAIALADRDGLDALSMRRLGQALGVEAMSLYHHVGSKDGLLSAMVDTAVAEIDVPDPAGPWRAELRRRCVSAHAALRRHPWLAMLMVSRINVGPAMLRYVDATIGCLFAAGFDAVAVDRGWTALDAHLYGFTLQELRFPVAPEQTADTAREHLPLISPDSHPHLSRLGRAVQDHDYPTTPDFEFGLDVILEGLARLRGLPSAPADD